VILALLVVPALAQTKGNAVDPLLGKWEENPAKTKSNLDRPKRSAVLILEAKGDGGQSTNIQVDADGKETKVVDMLYFDGKDYPRPGRVNFDSASWSRPATQVMYRIFKKEGKVVGVGVRTISKDGKTMISTVEVTQANGDQRNDLSFWDKTGE